MKLKRELLFVVAALIIATLACNLPGASSVVPEPAATTFDIPTTTPMVVVVENTATIAPTDTPIPPTETPSIPAEITLTKNSNCRKGPQHVLQHCGPDFIRKGFAGHWPRCR